MLFLGTACMAVMAYGFVKVWGGLVTPFFHPTIKKVGDTINDAAVKVSVELRYDPEEGVLQEQFDFSLWETVPFVFDYEDVGQGELLYTVFHLTAAENARLHELLTPLVYFESYCDMTLPHSVRDAQRRMNLAAVMTLFARIPDLRRSKLP